MPITTILFPISTTVLCILAFWIPDVFSLGKPHINTLLMFIMFGMGLTLSVADFKRVLKRKHIVALGVSLQFLIMPLAAYAISHLIGLPDDLMVGMILVGSTAGGTASNVICFLAKGDVALSVTLTLCSTLLAVILTPVLTLLLVGHTLPIDVLGMIQTVFTIVALPVLAGATINIYFSDKIAPLKPTFPFISMLSIAIIIAIIVALNKAHLTAVGPVILIAVILHNLIGLSLGYLIPKLLKQDEATCRTLAIEVGMQNSALSVGLASKYFVAGTALPGALFSIWHNLSGSFLASLWGHFHHVKTHTDHGDT